MLVALKAGTSVEGPGILLVAGRQSSEKLVHYFKKRASRSRHIICCSRVIHKFLSARKSQALAGRSGLLDQSSFIFFFWGGGA